MGFQSGRCLAWKSLFLVLVFLCVLLSVVLAVSVPPPRSTTGLHAAAAELSYSPNPPPPRHAIVSYISDDAWLRAALVLAYSLTRVLPPKGPDRPDLVCLHGAKLSPEAIRRLKLLFDEVVEVPRYDMPKAAEKTGLRLIDAYNFLQAWQLGHAVTHPERFLGLSLRAPASGYAKVLRLDPDMVALDSLHMLFKLPGAAAAPECMMTIAHDPPRNGGTPKRADDWFNSGLLLFEPSGEAQQRIEGAVAGRPLADGQVHKLNYAAGEQHLLNLIYQDELFEVPANYNFMPTCCGSAGGYPCMDSEAMHLRIKHRAAPSAVGVAEREGRARILHFARMFKPWNPCEVPGPGTAVWTDIWRTLESQMVEDYPQLRSRAWHAPPCKCTKVAQGASGGHGVARLGCPRGQVINGVKFASWGIGHNYCGEFVRNPKCHQARGAEEVVRAACVGKERCEFPADAETWNARAGGDPCKESTKELAVEITCGPTGSRRDANTIETNETTQVASNPSRSLPTIR